MPGIAACHHRIPAWKSAQADFVLSLPRFQPPGCSRVNTMWIVGVDAGGTTTRAAAAPVEGGPARAGHAEGANWTVHGPEVCAERIARAVTEALPTGVRPAAVCLGIAGYYPPDHREAAERWARGLWPGISVRVTTDVHAAWAGAFGGEPGIVLISGTGSIAYGRNARGEEARAGGWGPLFGDEGSAYAVGIACLRHLAMAVDWGAPDTPLTRRVLGRWPELGADLRTWLRGIYRHQWGREQVAALTEEVVLAAEEGDAGATFLLTRAAHDLLRTCEAVHTRLGREPLEVAIQGGLGSAPFFRRDVAKILDGVGIAASLVEARFTPLEGALLLAAEALDGPEGLRRFRAGYARSIIASLPLG